jgi:hypothetical protein
MLTPAFFYFNDFWNVEMVTYMLLFKLTIRRFLTAMLTNANSGVFYAETKFLLIFNVPIFYKIENMQRKNAIFFEKSPQHKIKNVVYFIFLYAICIVYPTL